MVVYIVHSNTIYPWFLSKTKTKAGYLTPSPFSLLDPFLSQTGQNRPLYYFNLSDARLFYSV